MTDKLMAKLISEYGECLREQSQITMLTSQQDDDSSKTPLLERVRNLLNSMTREDRIKGIELAELQIRLKGRKGKQAHAGEIAGCLRKLGYKRRRRWREGRTGFCSRWHPPEGVM